MSNRWLVLNFLPRDATAPHTGAVAFLTPKRLGPATVRNKLRRQMREIYRRHLQHADETHYLIWIARPPALQLDFAELKECMVPLLEKLA